MAARPAIANKRDFVLLLSARRFTNNATEIAFLGTSKLHKGQALMANCKPKKCKTNTL
jgi:hypothetical protein